MASPQARIGQQALAVLDVALRVPCIFIIDAIFNSYYDPGSGWAGAMGKVLVRVTGKNVEVLTSCREQPPCRVNKRLTASLAAAALAVTLAGSVKERHLSERLKPL